MTFSLPGFDLAAFVAATLAEDLGEVGDITSAAVIPADARFAGVMDSRDAIVVVGLPIAQAFVEAHDGVKARLREMVARGQASGQISASLDADATALSIGASPPGPNSLGKCAAWILPSKTLQSVIVSGPPRP